MMVLLKGGGSYYRWQQWHRSCYSPTFIAEGAQVAITGRDQKMLDEER
jgi:hypothetical protein